MSRRRPLASAALVSGATAFLLVADVARRWSTRPRPRVACCDVVNRGAAHWNGRIYDNTLDTQTVAVDAKTGAEVWRTKLGDIARGETITMA